MITTLLSIDRGQGGPPWKWVDVFRPTPGEVSALVEEYALHETSIRDCLDPGHLPKFEVVDENTFFIARFDSGMAIGDEGRFTVGGMTNKIAAFLGPHGLLTLHRHGQRVVDEVFPVWKERLAAPKSGANAALSPDLIRWRISLDLLEACVNTFDEPVREAQEAVERIEESVYSEHAPELPTQKVLLELYTLKRRGKVHSRMLHLLRNLLIRIEGPAEAPQEQKAPFAQDLAESCDRLMLLADEVLDTANQLLNFHLSLSTHRTNEVVRVLTVFSAFFMPLTFLAGLYGMNFQHMPELSQVWGYPALLGLMALVTLGIFLYFKRKKIM